MGLKIKFDPFKLYQDEKGQLCYPFFSDFTEIKGVFSSGLLTHLLPHIGQEGERSIFRFNGQDILISHRSTDKQ